MLILSYKKKLRNKKPNKYSKVVLTNKRSGVNIIIQSKQVFA